MTDDFTNGYLCAVQNLLADHGNKVAAKDLLKAIDGKKAYLSQLEADFKTDDVVPLLVETTDLPTRTVEIPTKKKHEGFPFNRAEVELVWLCPECGGPRGEVERGHSFDGSQRLTVDTWENPCDHVDKYSDVRKEVKANGLNKRLLEVT